MSRFCLGNALAWINICVLTFSQSSCAHSLCDIPCHNDLSLWVREVQCLENNWIYQDLIWAMKVKRFNVLSDRSSSTNSFFAHIHLCTLIWKDRIVALIWTSQMLRAYQGWLELVNDLAEIWPRYDSTLFYFLNILFLHQHLVHLHHLLSVLQTHLFRA